MDYELDLAILRHREMIRKAELIARLRHGEADGWTPARSRPGHGDRALLRRSLFGFTGDAIMPSWRLVRRWSAV